jgi:imidazoleglycerol phosphate dehydratase HisB
MNHKGSTFRVVLAFMLVLLLALPATVAAQDRTGETKDSSGLSLAAVSVDLSNRPFLVYHTPDSVVSGIPLSPSLAQEFFRALANRGGMNLHVNVAYGENDHHIIESIFKAFGRALDQAVSAEDRISGVPSSKGTL